MNGKPENIIFLPPAWYSSMWYDCTCSFYGFLLWIVPTNVFGTKSTCYNAFYTFFPSALVALCLLSGVQLNTMSRYLQYLCFW